MATVTTARRSGAGASRIMVIGLGAGLLATLANTLVYLVGRTLFTLPFLVPVAGPGSPPAPMSILAIFVACVVPALGAALLYWAIGRFTRRASTIFVVIAALLGLLSLAGPLSLPIDLGTRLALATMHLVAGLIITLGLLRFAPQR